MKTTRGCKLEVEWKYGTLRWILLKDLKSSNPVELDNIEDEYAFKWWVKDVLPKQNQINPKGQSKILKTTHKFGIYVPKTVDETYKIDQKMGTTLWKK